MIKLPTDRHGNKGWAVKARKPHRCESRGYGCVRVIQPGTFYYRAIVWPGSEIHEGPAPWVLTICRECLGEEMQRAFDAVTSPQPEPTALQLRTGPWRDIQGDVWTLGEDGLLHTPDTASFTREHVEKKWGPLVLEETRTAASHPPPPATGASTRATAHTTPETGAEDEREGA